MGIKNRGRWKGLLSCEPANRTCIGPGTIPILALTIDSVNFQLEFIQIEMMFDGEQDQVKLKPSYIKVVPQLLLRTEV